MSKLNMIEYSEHYVAFLDILGFTKLVRSDDAKDKRKIIEYFNLIEKFTKDIQSIPSKKAISSIIISDSVILSLPMGGSETEKITNLRNLCIAVQKIQFGLAEKNIWLRGAISNGEAYFSSRKNRIVGSAYIDAYFLEERIAKYPRVILDNKIIHNLDADSSEDLIEQVNFSVAKTDYDIPKNNVLFRWKHRGTQKIGLEKDVALFVDYLVYGLEGEVILNKIVTNIEQNIYSSDNSIYSKFRWVADYLLDSITHHNSFFGENGEDHAILMKIYSRLKKL